MSLKDNPLFKVLDRQFNVGDGIAQKIAETIKAMSDEGRHTLVDKIIHHDVMGDLDPFFRSSASDVQSLMGLMGATAFNGMKGGLLKALGDSHYGLSYDEAGKLAESIGFELVHIFKFWPLDPTGVEITDDPRREEHRAIWAHREHGIALVIESYTAIDDAENFYKRDVNTLRLYFAWDPKDRERGWCPRASGGMESRSRPNWRKEETQASIDGDVFPPPRDMVFVGDVDVRDGLVTTIEMMKLHGKFVQPHPGRCHFMRMSGVSFYTDYRRKEVLDANGQYRFGNKETESIQDAWRAERMAALPEWFRQMVGAE